MKNLMFLFLFVFGTSVYAQNDKVQLEKSGDLYEVTYFHDNGIVSQHGFFNLDGKLQGTWESFDVEGKKVSEGNYNNGKKAGKWLFWTSNSLTEVDYKDFKIEKINEWQNKSRLATRD